MKKLKTQFVVVVDGVVVADLGFREPGWQPSNSDASEAHYKHGLDARIVAVDGDVPVVIGDYLVVDEDGLVVLADDYD